MSTDRTGGIVFDMDGVLLDSSALHDQAFRQALAGFPIRVFDYTTVAGMRTKDALRQVLARNRLELGETELAALAAAKSAITLELVEASNPVFPGCVEVLAALSGEYPLALASSGSGARVNLFLARNGLREKFACVVHSEMVQSAKPAPEIYQMAARGLGLAPAECLVIEDAVNGVLAAKAAGARAWGIPNTSPAADLRAAGAERIIERLEDLLELTRGVLNSTGSVTDCKQATPETEPRPSGSGLRRLSTRGRTWPS